MYIQIAETDESAIFWNGLVYQDEATGASLGGCSTDQKTRCTC